MTTPWERAGLVPLSLPTPFTVGDVNVFLHRGDRLTLIDTGTCTPESEAALEAGLAAHGLRPGDIERVVLTHHHVDHTGLTARIAAAGGAEVWGHPDLEHQAQLGHARDAAHRQFFLDILVEFGVPEEVAAASMELWDAFKNYTEEFRVTHTLEDGGRVGPFEAYFVPGHSATDTLLVHREGGFTLGGDHILTSINPNPLLRRPAPGRPREHALVEYQASLHRSRTLPLGVVLPGHGAPIERPAHAIDGILAQHERRMERLCKALAEAALTPYTVCRHFYPELPLQHLYLGLSVATGLLEVLEARGHARHEHRDGVAHYLPARGD